MMLGLLIATVLITKDADGKFSAQEGLSAQACAEAKSVYLRGMTVAEAKASDDRIRAEIAKEEAYRAAHPNSLSFSAYGISSGYYSSWGPRPQAWCGE